MAFHRKIVSFYQQSGWYGCYIFQQCRTLEEPQRISRWVFAATPAIVIQLIGASYFQAIGRAPQHLAKFDRWIFLILYCLSYFNDWYLSLITSIADVLSTL